MNWESGKNIMCRLIGVDIEAIDTAEDREKFRQLMVRDWHSCCSVKNSQLICLKEKNLHRRLAFRLVIRPSFTLGGTGGGFVHDKEELEAALEQRT